LKEQSGSGKSGRVAVVGAGIFGVTAAVHLARAGHDVELFERSDRILSGASFANQYRLHRGYHYPRSKETALQSLRAEPAFREHYGEAVFTGGDHYYCIAASETKTSCEQFEAFCRDVGLSYEPVTLDLVDPSMIAGSYRVTERLIDVEALVRLCRAKIERSGVNLKLNASFDPTMARDYDLTVVATYANLNSTLPERVGTNRPFQFEVCEKPVVSLPPEFTGKSAVVMDGPFMCFDPIGRTGRFVLGNVVHAIHATNVAPEPIVDEAIAPMLDRGVVVDPAVTNIERFLEHGSRYIPGLRDARHLGSMFTIRAVLPHTDATDERPTQVTDLGDGWISIFSGKIGTCVEAAEEVVRIAEGRCRLRAVSRGGVDPV
jgi:hypothetical protein